MKKISSVLLAFMMLFTSVFCANVAFADDMGKNTFQSAESLETGKVYNRPATEITGSYWFKFDSNQAGKFTLSLASNSVSTVEIYQNDDKNILDTVYVFGDKAQKKTSTKNFDFSKGTYYFKIVSIGDYTFSLSNYVCTHYFDVVTTAPTYFENGYSTYTCSLCGYSYKTAGDTKKKLKTPKIYSLKGGKKKITVNNSNNKVASGYQIKLSTSKKFTKKTTKTVKVKSSKSTVKKLKSNKKYYVKVRTYKTQNGKTVYSSWSKVKSIKTK
ncbi:MAG: hypothetical protein SOY48_00025 [Eubacterium sp.]|nr:hypothetical protein [Eubacterium sp.]MDY4109265.1 hypothetical protein [Eubacterium sp.]